MLVEKNKFDLADYDFELNWVGILGKWAGFGDWIALFLARFRDTAPHISSKRNLNKRVSYFTKVQYMNFL